MASKQVLGAVATAARSSYDSTTLTAFGCAAATRPGCHATAHPPRAAAFHRRLPRVPCLGHPHLALRVHESPITSSVGVPFFVNVLDAAAAGARVEERRVRRRVAAADAAYRLACPSLPRWRAHPRRAPACQRGALGVTKQNTQRALCRDPQRYWTAQKTTRFPTALSVSAFGFPPAAILARRPRPPATRHPSEAQAKRTVVVGHGLGVAAAGQG